MKGLDLADLQPRAGARSFAGYGEAKLSGLPGTLIPRSKFANLLFTYELARRLEGTGVAAALARPDAPNLDRGSHRPHHLDQVEEALARAGYT